MERTHSFMVLAYGESPFLPDCLRSLAAQTHQSDIVLCTSTPNAFIMETAEAFGVNVLVNHQKPSIATDWQFAIDSCKTAYFTLAHQDDLYYPEYAERMLSRMERSVIAFCDYEEIVDARTRRHTMMLTIKRLLLWPFLFGKYLSAPWAKRLVLKFGSPVCCPSVMYNRARLNGFRFNPDYRVDLDWDAWLRLSDYDGSFSYVHRVLMAHRIHADSETTRQIHSNRRNAEDALMLKRQWKAPLSDVLIRLYAHSTDSNEAGEKGGTGK